MIHLPPLISDLALILAAAGVVTIIFKVLGQPIVLGYILAGLLVGPHVPFAPSVIDNEAIKVWAEVGVIFLLFGLGLEFSFRKLARVGAPAAITAVFEVVFMLALGFIAGQVMGWSRMDSLFLGGVLSISSTTIIIRAFDELNLRRRGFVSLVFGVLVVEDLVAILLLVLLSTVAATQAFQGEALLESVGKLTFFLVLWFLGGIFFVPSVLRRVRGQLSEETTVILSIALCLIMVVSATAVGFSPALGAFIMGSILAETPEAERIEHLTRPVKDLFAAVFFVSVGMLIDPKIIMEYGGPILIVTLLTIVGKIVSTAGGALISGRSLRHSVQAGFSLAQIGEFSFIIATLGLTLKVTSDFLYPIAVAVSAITTFTTPYLIRCADPVYTWLDKHLPKRMTASLNRYQYGFQNVSRQEEWRAILKSYALRLVANGVIVIGIFLLITRFFEPVLGDLVSYADFSQYFALGLAFVVAAPFLWAMILGGVTRSERRELFQNRANRGPIIAVEVGRVVLGTLLLALLATRLVGALQGFIFSAAFLGIIMLVSKRHLAMTYKWFETRFVTNLTARDQETKNATLAPWDAHLVEVVVSPDSPCVGQTLLDLKVRETYGVTIALIKRGRKQLTAPGRTDILMPGDRISVIGTDEQIQKFTEVTSDHNGENGETPAAYRLEKIDLDDSSPVAGRTIRESGIRERVSGLVVGIERSGRRILNPDSTMTLEKGDTLWVVGDPDRLKALKS